MTDAATLAENETIKILKPKKYNRHLKRMKKSGRKLRRVVNQIRAGEVSISQEAQASLVNELSELSLSLNAAAQALRLCRQVKSQHP